MKKIFEDYCNYMNYEYVLFNPKADISGGVLEKAQIDDIKNHPEVNKIRIMGLKQDTFEYFIEKYGQQFKAIYFFKNKAVKDLSPLSSLENVEFIGYFFNQGCTRLWEMNKNFSLKGLAINDFSKLHNLDDIVTAPNLEFFDFGNMVWSSLSLDTLKPLAKTKLKYLQFNAKIIADKDITPIAEIKTLEGLSFPTNLFETEQIAWLTAKLVNVKSSSLGPYHKIDTPIEWESSGRIKMKDTFIHGKGKPFLDSNLDKSRIDKYVKEFEEMVRKFSNIN
jgi:hypothetical protein